MRCPACQGLAVVPTSETPIDAPSKADGVGGAKAIPIEDDGDVLPSLEDLQKPLTHATRSEVPEIALPNAGKIQHEKITSGLPEPADDLESLVDGLLASANDLKKDDPNAPLKFDDDEDVGVGDGDGDDVMGILCSVCDTRIHVRRDKVGTRVECPVCFVQVPVVDQKKKNKVWGRGGTTAPEDRQNESEKRVDPTRPNPTMEAEVKPDFIIRASGGGAAALPDLDSLEDSQEDESLFATTDEPIDDLGELRLSDPIERPTVDPLIGLDPVDDDLLSPFRADSPESNLVGHSNDLSFPDPSVSPVEKSSTPSPSSVSSPKKDQAVRPKANTHSQSDALKAASRKARLEAAELRSRQEESDVGLVFEVPPEQQDFPEFEHASLVSATRGAIFDGGVVWRALVATGFMIVGALGTEAFFPHGTYAKIDGFGDLVSRGLSTFAIGVVPYYIGLMILWFTCANVFRDTALGYRKVKDWGFHGSSELVSTFLLFAFSFFLAGSLAIFLPILMMPLRVLIGPIFLTAAFFNRSPWGIIAVDTFSNFGKLKGQWLTFYTWMVTLAVMGLLSGGLFLARNWTETYAIDAGLSIFGILINVLITLVFSPLAGWQAGLIIKDLQEQ